VLAACGSKGSIALTVNVYASLFYDFLLTKKVFPKIFNLVILQLDFLKNELG